MKDKLANYFHTFERQTVFTTLFILSAFMWTSSAYMAWTSHLTTIATNTVTYLATEVGGCITQIVGLFLFMLLLKYNRNPALSSRILIALMLLDGFTVLLMLFSSEALSVVIWGLIMNVFHGAIAAWYITRLSCYIPKNRRAFGFGIGYAFGNIGAYLLSGIGGGHFLESGLFAIALFVLIAVSSSLAICMELDIGQGRESDGPTSVIRITKRAVPVFTCILAGGVILLLATASQLLFFFPAKEYINNTAALHSSHVFYAIGLVIAAFVNDKKRNAGLILAVLSLCFPILSLSLYRFTALLTALSIIGYTVVGFFTVYRVVVFTDLYDDDSRLLLLAPMGLLCGRFGEALGALLGYLIGSHHIALTVLTAVLFIITIILVFLLYVRLYSEQPVTTAEDRANRFYSEHDLSMREQQVFLLLADGKTNQEIADALFISENTVKFHVRNILKKTDCKKRGDIIKKFQSFTGKLKNEIPVQS